MCRFDGVWQTWELKHGSRDKNIKEKKQVYVSGLCSLVVYMSKVVRRSVRGKQEEKRRWYDFMMWIKWNGEVIFYIVFPVVLVLFVQKFSPLSAGAATYSLNISLRLCWLETDETISSGLRKTIITTKTLGSTPCFTCIAYNTLHQFSLWYVTTQKFWREFSTKWQLPWGVDNVINMAR